MEEPIADILRGVLDGHVVLSREIAERGRYPAIDVLRSVSRSLPEAASASENHLILTVRKLLGAYDRSEAMIRAGLYREGEDPVLDRAIRVWEGLDLFMTESAPNGPAAAFSRLELLLRRAEAGNTGRNAPRSAQGLGTGRQGASGSVDLAQGKLDQGVSKRDPSGQGARKLGM